MLMLSVTCIKCGRIIKDIQQAQPIRCSHYSCPTCVISLADYMLSHPRNTALPTNAMCCGYPIITDRFVRAYKSYKLNEVKPTVVEKDRLYCFSCRVFLGSSSEHRHSNAVECPGCLLSTCPHCKKRAHLVSLTPTPLVSRARQLLLNAGKGGRKRSRSPSPKRSIRKIGVKVPGNT